ATGVVVAEPLAGGALDLVQLFDGGDGEAVWTGDDVGGLVRLRLRAGEDAVQLPPYGLAGEGAGAGAALIRELRARGQLVRVPLHRGVPDEDDAHRRGG